MPWVIDPSTRIYCDGWESTAYSLVQNGWYMEKQYDQMYMATRFVMRNPSKCMVAQCMIEEERYQNHPSMYSQGTPILYFNGEALLIKAEMYKELKIPVGELQEIKVGEPMCDPSMYRGLREYDESMWRYYTPSGDKDTQELIVTPDKIPMLLDEIRKAQEPAARENIMSQHKRGLTELKTKAKILAFA